MGTIKEELKAILDNIQNLRNKNKVSHQEWYGDAADISEHVLKELDLDRNTTSVLSGLVHAMFEYEDALETAEELYEQVDVHANKLKEIYDSLEVNNG